MTNSGLQTTTLPTSNLPQDLIQYTKYKWEFLRRNQRYIDGWEKLQKILENKYGEWRPPNGELTNEEVDFCIKWKMSHPFAPDVSCDQLERVAEAGKLDTYALLYHWLYPACSSGRPFTIVGEKEIWDTLGSENGATPQYTIPLEAATKLANTGKLTVEVDLNYSKNRPMKEFKILIDEWKTSYEHAYLRHLHMSFMTNHNTPIDDNLKQQFKKICEQDLKKRQRKYRKKYHFDNFDTYLQVYDLKQEGKSWAKITSTLNLNSVQTARNHYNAACEMIEKGVDLYVK
ncbi:MAG: hypothetical protein JRE23_05100 [Deltaproteobacteria bacterium]|nr:hypothetical protein [Deltaproteobacteria bacterium]